MVHEILQLLYLHQRHCVDYGREEKCGKYDLLQGNVPVLSGKTKKNQTQGSATVAFRTEIINRSTGLLFILYLAFLQLQHCTYNDDQPCLCNVMWFILFC